MIERRRKKHTIKLTDRLIGGEREKRREGGEGRVTYEPPSILCGVSDAINGYIVARGICSWSVMVLYSRLWLEYYFGSCLLHVTARVIEVSGSIPSHDCARLYIGHVLGLCNAVL